MTIPARKLWCDVVKVNEGFQAVILEGAQNTRGAARYVYRKKLDKNRDTAAECCRRWTRYTDQGQMPPEKELGEPDRH